MITIALDEEGALVITAPGHPRCRLTPDLIPALLPAVLADLVAEERQRSYEDGLAAGRAAERRAREIAAAKRGTVDADAWACLLASMPAVFAA